MVIKQDSVEADEIEDKAEPEELLCWLGSVHVLWWSNILQVEDVNWDFQDQDQIKP